MLYWLNAFHTCKREGSTRIWKGTGRPLSHSTTLNKIWQGLISNFEDEAKSKCTHFLRLLKYIPFKPNQLGKWNDFWSIKCWSILFKYHQHFLNIPAARSRTWDLFLKIFNDCLMCKAGLENHQFNGTNEERKNRFNEYHPTCRCKKIWYSDQL